MPDHELVAIDIALLLPEGANQRAKAANAAMLAARSQGSERLRFDATHLPHITLVQMFVRDYTTMTVRYEGDRHVDHETGPFTVPHSVRKQEPCCPSGWRSGPVG